MADGKELRKQVRELRRRSSTLRERSLRLTSTYNALQKHWNELCSLMAEHRRALADRRRNRASTPISTSIPSGNPPVVFPSGDSAQPEQAREFIPGEQSKAA